MHSHDDPDAAAGKGGTGAFAGRGGGGRGGTVGIGASGGRGGTYASGGSGGTFGSGMGGMAGACREATAIAECKTRSTAEGFCSARANCSCNSCSCELAACEGVASCAGILECVARTRCCTPDDMNCVGAQCVDTCAPEISAGAADQGLQLILSVSACVATARCTPCPAGAGGSGASGGSGGTGTGGMPGACREATAIAECKTRSRGEGFCSARADCSCNSCSCELAACENVATCKAILACVARTHCCTSDDTACVGARCTDTCAPEIAAGAADQGLQLALAMSTCVATARCAPCPAGDGGS